MSENSLRSVLERLVHECHAVLAFEHELREISVLGNTNVNAFKLKVEAADAALAPTQEPQPHDSRTFEEVIQLHIDSSESMLGVFQRTGDAPGAGMQRGVTAGLKRAIEVYGNWSKRGVAGAPAASGRELRERVTLLHDQYERMRTGEGLGSPIGREPRMILDLVVREISDALEATREAAAPRPELAPRLDEARGRLKEALLWESGGSFSHDWAKERIGELQASYDLLASREAPPDLAALERLVKEWRQPLEVESPLQGAFKKHYEYQRRKCADELAAQLKVQR